MVVLIYTDLYLNPMISSSDPSTPPLLITSTSLPSRLDRRVHLLLQLLPLHRHRVITPM